MDPMGEMMEEPEGPEGRPDPWRLAAIYGVVVGVALFFVGWVTGMGGSFWPNLSFSALMGLLAAGLFRLVIKFRGAK